MQNPLKFVDPNGLAVWGITFGGGGAIRGVAGDISVSIALDSNGTLLVVRTPGGGGTPGIGAFARALGGSGTVDDLLGPGTSVSVISPKNNRSQK